MLQHYRGAGAGEDGGELTVHQVQSRASPNTSNQSVALLTSAIIWSMLPVWGVDHLASKCGHKGTVSLHSASPWCVLCPWNLSVGDGRSSAGDSKRGGLLG